MKMNKTVWVMGKWMASIDKSNAWELMGIFDEKHKNDAVAFAVKHNSETDGDIGKYFIGPVEFNTMLPDESEEWCGAYYPMPEAKELCNES